MQSEVSATFTSGERDYIRRQLDRFVSTLPTVSDGFQLKTWRGGPEAGRPKLRPIAKGLVERGLSWPVAPITSSLWRWRTSLQGLPGRSSAPVAPITPTPSFQRNPG